MPLQLLIWSWILLLIGALLAPALNRWPRLASLAGSLAAAFGSCGMLLAAVGGLSGGQTQGLQFTLPLSLPGASLALNLDPLAAFFLMPIALVGLLGAVYGNEYMAGHGRWPGLHWSMYNLLLLAMAVVVSSANALLFLFAWECMSLSSFLLVVGDHRDPAVSRAGFIYLLATHLGAALLFAFFLAAGATAGSFDFAAFGALGQVSAPLASTFFVLLLVGFGSKAGLFPLHVWLPEAHPAAPSHVSALMSGVMVKTAVYGLLRFVSFLPAAPAWWGGLLLTLGLAGALFGIALAASQTDMKRSLAYSTVENIGIIALALGFWLYARGTSQPLAATLALTGALLHVWNHALFKSLLFLGAGSLVHGLGTRNMNQMGGLFRRMPRTGFWLMVGCLAVAALPPANGLVGEWFIYRALLESGVTMQGLTAFLPLIALGLLALVGGMVLVVFTRLLGIALLGDPRHPQAAEAHESGWRITGVMAVLGLLCLAGGLLPAIAVLPASQVAAMLDPASAAGLGQQQLPLWLGWLGWGLVLTMAVVVGISRWLQARHRTGASSTWGCGFAFPTSRMSYSAEGFTELASSSLLSEALQPVVADGRSLSLFPEAGHFAHRAPDVVLDGWYLPLFTRIAGGCSRLRHLQSGLLHVYMFYLFSATLVLLVWAALR